MIYNEMEKILVEGAKLADALALDLLLLKLESSVGLMDGLPMVKESGADGN